MKNFNTLTGTKLTGADISFFVVLIMIISTILVGFIV